MHYLEQIRRRMRISNVLARNLLAEFYGTALLRLIGTGVMAQFVLSRGMINAPIQVNIGWGLAIGLSVYVAWEISGGHVNPAVTSALFVLGEITFCQSVFYCIAQTFGAAFGAGIIYLVYYEALDDFDGGIRTITGPNATGIIFASFPQPFLSNTGAFLDQVVATALIGVFVAFCCESKNQIPSFLKPTLFGFVAMTISMFCGLNMGSPVNPASDFGSRLMASLAGYGIEMFTFHNYFFIVPLLAPILGAIIGAYSYLLFIGFHIPKSETSKVNTDGPKEIDKISLNYVFQKTEN